MSEREEYTFYAYYIHAKILASILARNGKSRNSVSVANRRREKEKRRERERERDARQLAAANDGIYDNLFRHAADGRLLARRLYKVSGACARALIQFYLPTCINRAQISSFVAITRAILHASSRDRDFLFSQYMCRRLLFALRRYKFI